MSIFSSRKETANFDLDAILNEVDNPQPVCNQQTVVETVVEPGSLDTSGLRTIWWLKYDKIVPFADREMIYYHLNGDYERTRQVCKAMLKTVEDAKAEWMEGWYSFKALPTYEMCVQSGQLDRIKNHNYAFHPCDINYTNAYHIHESNFIAPALYWKDFV